jgi:hypothetical protein
MNVQRRPEGQTYDPRNQDYENRGRFAERHATRRRTVFLWWRGPKSIVDHPKVIAAVEAGLIDEDDVWADEAKRHAAVPFRHVRIMGPTNAFGKACPERLERVYVFGPEPWEFAQEVLESDARQIMKGPSRREFQVMKATTLSEAQEEVWKILFPDKPVDLSGEFLLACTLLDGLGLDSADLMRLAVPAVNGGR